MGRHQVRDPEIQRGNPPDPHLLKHNAHSITKGIFRGSGPLSPTPGPRAARPSAAPRVPRCGLPPLSQRAARGMSPPRMAQPTPAAWRGHFSPHSPSPLPQPRSPPPAASSLSPAAADRSRLGAGVTIPSRRDTVPRKIPRSSPVPPAAPGLSSRPPATGGTGRAGNAES